MLYYSIFYKSYNINPLHKQKKEKMTSIFGIDGGLGDLYGHLCVFWTFDTHSHKFQHKNKLHRGFHDDSKIKSIFGDFFKNVSKL